MSDIAALVSNNLDIWTSAVERKSSSGRGSSKKVSLYGIELLRALILDLAVRGKLVSQSETDEPASKLLSQFDVQQDQWVAEKRVRRRKPLPPVREDEYRFDPPIGWAWTRFGNLGDWGAGATPNRKNSSYYGGETPWFKSGELVGDYISQSEETVTELALKECSLRLNAPGDVLIAMYGATIGKTSILEIAATTNQAVCACSPFDGVGNRFLLLMLKAMRPLFVGQGAGGAQPNISREKIVATPLCLPPYAEQKRIVAKVDELMALCDALERESEDALAAHQTLVDTLLATLVNSTDASDLAKNWARLEKHFDTLFTADASIDSLQQVILELGITGKLIQQSMQDGSGVELYDEIMKRRAKLEKDNKVAKVKIKSSGPKNVKKLPEYWFSANLGLVLDVRDGTHDTPKYISDGYPLVTSKNLSSGLLDLSDVKFISEEDYLAIAQRSEVKKGDILFAMIGSIGNPAEVKSNTKFSIKNVALFKAFAPDLLDTKYLMIFLRCAQVDMKSNASGGVQKFVSLSFLRSYPFPLPPLAEQKRIVAKVDELMAVCDALKSRLSDAAETQRHLADAIVERAAA